MPSWIMAVMFLLVSLPLQSLRYGMVELWCLVRTPTADLSVMADEKRTRKSTWSEKVRRTKALLKNLIKLRRGLTIDSGAADHVMPSGWLPWVKSRPSAGSVRGLHYVAANGARIANEGEQSVELMTEEGSKGKWTFQVAKVNKPLASVGKLLDTGHRVVLDEDGSYVLNKRTRQVMRIRRERGVFVLDVWLSQDSEGDVVMGDAAAEAKIPSSGFTGQA